METAMTTAAKREQKLLQGKQSSGGADDVPRTLWVGQLLGQEITGPRGRHLGHVRDIVAGGLSDPVTPQVVTGLIVDLDGHPAFVSADAVHDWRPLRVTIDVLPAGPSFFRQLGEVLLGADALGRLVLTATAPQLTRIQDIVLHRIVGGWIVGGADLRTAAQAMLGPTPRMVEWEVLVQRRLVRAPQRRADGAARWAAAQTIEGRARRPRGGAQW
jgi:hypothetical protein